MSVRSHWLRLLPVRPCRRPHPRGPRTSQAIEFYDSEAMKCKRGPKGAIAELAIDHSVPDIAELVLKLRAAMEPKSSRLVP
jgi:hypothetical protein